MLDIYSLEPGSQVLSVAVPLVSEDMTLALLTSSDNLYTLRLVINDFFGEQESSSGKKKTVALHQELRFQAGEEHRANVREMVLKNDLTMNLTKSFSFKQIVNIRGRGGKSFIGILDDLNHLT